MSGSDSTPKGLVLKVASEKELHSSTLEGWLLKEVLTCDVIEQIQRQEVVFPPAPMGGVPYAQTMTKHEQAVVRQLRFLLVKDEGSELARLNKELSDERVAKSDLTEQIKLVRKDLEALEKRNRDYTSELARLEKAHNDAQESSRQERHRVHAFEADIAKIFAKIRKEVGEAEMRRILGR